MCFWSRALEKPLTLEEPHAGEVICDAEVHHREPLTTLLGPGQQAH